MSIILSLFSRRTTFGAAQFAMLATGASLLLATGPAHAQVVTFAANDAGAGPGTVPVNSNAAAAQFDAAVTPGSESLVTFESAPVGTFSSLNIAPGVMMTGVDFNGNQQEVGSSPSFPIIPALGAFNTTLGGTNYLDINGGTVTFSFAQPIQAFGAYFTGVQPPFFQDTISFDDGTSMSFDIPGAAGSVGGVSFAGFTDQGQFISKVIITASDASGGDLIGLDDLRFASVAAVPEASTMASFGLLLALGLGRVVAAARKKKVAASA